MEDETITREQILKELNSLRKENARLKGERLSWGKTKQALADSQQKLDLAIKGSNGGLWQIFMDPGDAKNPVSDRIYLSPQCKALLGYEDNELPNSLTSWARLIPPEDRPLLQERAMAALADGADMFADEYRIRHKDGSVRWHRLHGRLQRDAFGAPLHWSGMVWDVTMRKQAEIALRESEEKYRAAFELAPVGVGHVTAEGTYLLANQRLCEILGYSSAELRRMTTHEVTHPDDVEEGRGLLEKIGAGIISRYAREKRYLRKDGTTVWVYITVSTVRDAAGRPQVLYNRGPGHFRTQKGRRRP